ncbi:hypothetical protein OG874_00520 [Nocardia sp. NBC_00565]|uniref:hypothetical protein n=1 Tax=Nocardia sp. NBC_00565 TaxID=2975993 RepID=UPI002E8078B8|nr:hypothetical protein [Nocardia sp. NBC_00565]WUC03739.1 hypothetical protein OG874_00520 [Nocardia sp. NBC_00565]
MKYRCNNGFIYYTAAGEKTITGGMEVDGDDPILQSHRAHFVAMAGSDPEPPVAVRTEVATAAPDEMRALPTPKRGPSRGRKASPADGPAEPDPAVEPAAKES